MSKDMAVPLRWDLLLWRNLVCQYIWESTSPTRFNTMEILSMTTHIVVPSHGTYYYGDT